MEFEAVTFACLWGRREVDVRKGNLYKNNLFVGEEGGVRKGNLYKNKSHVALPRRRCFGNLFMARRPKIVRS